MKDTLALLNESMADILTVNEHFMVAAPVMKRGAGRLGTIGDHMVHNPGFAGGFAGEREWRDRRMSRHPDPDGLWLPDKMIWALSSSRLFMWATDMLTERRPTRFIATFSLASEVSDASVGRGWSAGYGKTELSITIKGAHMRVELQSDVGAAFVSAVGGPA